MNTTNVVPTRFTVRSPKGVQLSMKRLFCFWCFNEFDQNPRAYVAAIESKFKVVRPELIDVFQIDPITGAPLWVSIDEEHIYNEAYNTYHRWTEAQTPFEEYRKNLCRRYGSQKIMPYLEELERHLLRRSTAGKDAEQLCCRYERKAKVLHDLRKAICAADGRRDIHESVDKLIFCLWGKIDGLEIAERLLPEVEAKAKWLNMLCSMIIRDAADVFDVSNRARRYVLRTYWEIPCNEDFAYRAMNEHFGKAALIEELLKEHAKIADRCSVTKEDIHALWFDPDWLFTWRKYNRECIRDD